MTLKCILWEHNYCDYKNIMTPICSQCGKGIDSKSNSKTEEKLSDNIYS